MTTLDDILASGRIVGENDCHFWGDHGKNGTGGRLAIVPDSARISERDLRRR